MISTDILVLPEAEIDALNVRFASEPAERILRWAWNTFAPDIAASSSFQTQSVPLLHIISRVCPELPIIFIDTGYHFPETLAFRDELRARYHLNVVVIQPTVTKSEIMQKYGEALYRHDPDLCCYINKVSPMQWAISWAQAWVSGVRHDQTADRKEMHIFQIQENGLLRVHPMLNWTEDDINAYRQAHNLPVHPLYHLGYTSVGCAPCTRPVFLGENMRAGRWADSEKRECGLHLNWNEQKGEQ